MPRLVTIDSFAADGDRAVGAEVIVRVQFVPSADLTTKTPTARAGDVVGTWICRPRKTAATPARATRMTITRTTRTAVRLLVE